MSRWDYDQMLYRVFCITLLGIAFAFTVILTNVFIDIDGLLYKKSKVKTQTLERVTGEINEVISPVLPEPPESYYDEQEYDESIVERSKRSLESQDIMQHINNPKFKTIIKNRLANYLEQLDDEYSNQKQNRKSDCTTETPEKIEHKDEQVKKDDKENRRQIGILKDKDEKKDELLHLGMHNIILQGIIANSELRDVYEKVQELMKSNNKLDGKENKADTSETKFVNELMNCRHLHDDIAVEKVKRQQKMNALKHNNNNIVLNNGQKLVIKTIIDIKPMSVTNDRSNQDDEQSSKENLNANSVIKLIYNGKALKFKKVEETTLKPNNTIRTTTELPPTTKNYIINSNYVPKINLKKMINDYLKNAEINIENDNAHKRLKRHIKIEYEADSNSTDTPKANGKKDEDELFVEIETHFDTKGLKGDRKKKMVRELVEKIQKALHSTKEPPKKKKHNRFHVKKRIQNPLDTHLQGIEKKMVTPYTDNLMHRKIEVISKQMTPHENVPYIGNSKGENWQKKYNGPSFLKPSKTINSAEFNEMYTDYNKVLENGIPQRLIKPLHSDDNSFNPTDYLDNVKFILKDIEGSGFAIGINQFTDLPPDADSIKLFTGLENILQTYHQKFDQDGGGGGGDETKQSNENPKPDMPYLSVSTPDHEINKRSIQNYNKNDYHSNEYKVIFNGNYLPYDNYQDIYNTNIKSRNKSKSNSKGKTVLTIDENILNENLKPAEIFSLAHMFDRKKRSIRVKKLLNIRSNKKTVTKCLNQNKISRKIMREKKRHKRQINKIRIVARDMDDKNKNSNEEIFFVSDEKVFADRAIVKDVVTPELYPTDDETDEKIELPQPNPIVVEHNHQHEHIDVISPQKVTNDHYDILTPYVYEPSKRDHADVFTKVSRHNALMSKYPHIFLEDIGKTNTNIYETFLQPDEVEVTTKITAVVINESPRRENKYYLPITQEKIGIYDIPKLYSDSLGILPGDDDEKDRDNYQVSVKIQPKNVSENNPGFKEVHASINKSYNKNGLVYTSLVNVSELSKVEKENNSNIYKYIPSNVDAKTALRLRHEHEKIKHIIDEHKHRLERQLAALNDEKKNLERLALDNYMVNYDIPTVTNTPATIPTTPTVPTTTVLTTVEPTTIPTTTQTTTTTTEKPVVTPVASNKDILRLYKTVQKSDNNTQKILRKINENNQILQHFLGKLFRRIHSATFATTATIKTTAKPAPATHPPEPATERVVYDKNDFNHNLEVYNQLRNMFLDNSPQDPLRNDTMAIPFVYAYRHPILNVKNNIKSAANIVYHGHIHTDALSSPLYSKEPPKKPQIKSKAKLTVHKKQDSSRKVNLPKIRKSFNNDTRFFIDDLENDYKILPVIQHTMANVTM